MTKRKSTKTTMPWFKFHTANYVTATVNLSAAERAIWLDLTRLFWEYGSLPDDMDKIRLKMLRLLDCRQYKLVPGVLEKCFERTDDGRWFNPEFGDHHLQVGDTIPQLNDKVPQLTDKVPQLTDKVLQCDDGISNDINVPDSRESEQIRERTEGDKERQEQKAQRTLSPTIRKDEDDCPDSSQEDDPDRSHEVSGGDSNPPTPPKGNGGGQPIPPTDDPAGGGGGDDATGLTDNDGAPRLAPEAPDGDYGPEYEPDTLAAWVVVRMHQLFQGLQTTRSWSDLPSVIEAARSFLESGTPQQVQDEYTHKASVGGVMKFSEAIFKGHDYKPTDIDNLSHYLFSRDDPNPSTLGVTVWLWHRDHPEFPTPYAVKEVMWQAENLMAIFINQMACINHEIATAEEKLSAYECMKDVEQDEQEYRFRRRNMLS